MTARILLKTTIGPVPDDWNVGRFSFLAAHLRDIRDSSGKERYDVVARDRVENSSGDDIDLEECANGVFDQVWLIAVDTSGALTPGDIEHIARFRQRGGGMLLTRDHQDLGACLAGLGALGATQFFQTINPDPDESHRCRDDMETLSIGWPNFHSGANGDLQPVSIIEPFHPLMRTTSGDRIRYLPAHPHEGAVGIPAALGHNARIAAQGRSKTTRASFNLCVAVEESNMGRAVSDSSFHHFCDYNWNPEVGCPSFVTERAGSEVLSAPDALDGAYQYVENIAAWLEGHI
jgi:hypothetical protein